MGQGIPVNEVLATVERIAGHPLYDDEGVVAGTPDRLVQCATVCWMATAPALRQAAADSCQLVITHESLFYPYNARPQPGRNEPWEHWPTNHIRRQAIEEGGLTVVRIHMTADELCIFDAFAELLGLGAPEAHGHFNKVYEIPPVTLRELVQRVKDAVGMEHVRLSCPDGNLNRIVHRVGLPWGGLGLFVNVSYQNWAIEQNCDVLIAGESDSYGFRFSAECGIPMIETTHEASEIPGLRRFTDLLAQNLPQVRWHFFDNGTAWVWL